LAPGTRPASSWAPRQNEAAGSLRECAEAALDPAEAVALGGRDGACRSPGGGGGGRDRARSQPWSASGSAAPQSTISEVPLLALRDGELVVLDFKTDAPPAGEVVASYPAYVEQVRSYERILVGLGVATEGWCAGGCCSVGMASCGGSDSGRGEAPRSAWHSRVVRRGDDIGYIRASFLTAALPGGAIRDSLHLC